MRWKAPHHPATQTPKGKRVTGLTPGTAVRNNIYRQGGLVTWQCIPPNGDCPQAQCPVPWWGSGARISTELRSRCRLADVQLSRPIYWTPSSYSAAPKETASRFGRRPARLFPELTEQRTALGSNLRSRWSSQSLCEVKGSAPPSHTNPIGSSPVLGYCHTYSLPYRPLPLTLLVIHARLACSLPYT